MDIPANAKTVFDLHAMNGAIRGPDVSRKFPVVRKVPLWSGMTKRFGLVGSVIAIDVYAVVDATVAASDIMSPAYGTDSTFLYNRGLRL